MTRFALVRLLLAALLLLSTMLRPALAEDEYLDPAQAFQFSAQMIDGSTVAVTYEIADGYYMYRERFKFGAVGATLGTPAFPPGKVKYDQTFEKNVETYRHSVTIRIPVQASGMFTLNVTGQGCADAGLCYAPQDVSVRLVGGGAPAATTAAPPADGGSSVYPPAATPAAQADLPGQAAPVAGATPAAAAPAQPAVPAPAAPETDVGRIGRVLTGGNLLAIIPAFIVLGLGLAFTPCVLPMVPILSSIIVGEGTHVRRSRGFLLSLAYSLGMAIVYTTLGVAAGLVGEGLAAALQNPWVLGAFALLMVGMALSMFGFYQLQMPAAVQTRLTEASGRQHGGRTAGVFLMGAISALIVGPCVAAPLAGALVYISQTRNVVIGGAALFSMAIGMSIPLLLVGLSAGSLLPKAGAWMESVKRFFGVLMLGMALWLVSPVLPPAAQMLGWTVLFFGYGAFLLRRSEHWLATAAGAAFLVLGGVQLAGLATGGRDPLAPLAHLRGNAQAERLPFQRIKSTADLDAVLARLDGKTAMLDFYADWCVSCKEMEKLTFSDPRVHAALANTVLLQVDVTANDLDDKAMLKRFGLFGPPGIILFGKDGKELPGSRVVGYQAADKFLESLARLR
ncbi:MAG TPA: protein-disulfide reductase DsbD [Telluria sp.]|nr:protein-disulfide reductase DsbD [Telluria sp.]